MTARSPIQAYQYTEREIAFLQAHAEYFRRPADWNADRAGSQDSTFAAVRAWLSRLDRFEPGPFEKACEQLHRAGIGQPPLADLKNVYFAILKRARETMHANKVSSSGQIGSQHSMCQNCGDTGSLIACYTRNYGGRVGWPTVDRPTAGRWYEVLVPCLCQAGSLFSSEMKMTYDNRQLEALSRIAFLTGPKYLQSSMDAIATLRKVCQDALANGTAIQLGAIRENVVEWAEGNQQGVDISLTQQQEF